MLASFMSYLQLVKQDPREQRSEPIKNPARSEQKKRGKTNNHIRIYMYIYTVCMKYDTIWKHTVQKQLHRSAALGLLDVCFLHGRFLCTCMYV
jgi:hypothetical protein